MTISARVRNFVLVCHCWAYESERVTADVHICNSLFDPRHVTGHALIACTSNFVMRVFLNRAYVWTIRRSRTVAFEAHDVCWFDQQSVVIGAVDVVATGALYTARIHNALNKIVSLHSVLMRCTFRKMSECRLA